jgi:Na+/H+-dicarboxylate symporter
MATLPLTIKTCNEQFNVPSKVTNIVVPLGCTIHMCGGAVSFALLGIFNMQLFNIALTPVLFLQLLLFATIINMAAPGIPNGGIVIGATYLSIFGVPLEFIGFYSGIYKLLDMSYTTLNVTGDITANILLSKNLKEESIE